MAELISVDIVCEILREAREQVLQASDAHHRYSHLEFIAEAQAEAGDVDEAIRTANEMGKAPRGKFDSLFTKESALWAVHRARRDIGDIQGARKVEPHLSKEAAAESKDLLLGLLAEQKAMAKDYNGAKLAVEAIAHPERLALGMADFAYGQARAGDAQGALRTVRSITDKMIRATAFKTIAVAQATRGDFAGAVKTAGAIGESNEQADAYWEIALLQASSGAFAEALATVEKLGDGWAYENALLDVANIQARAGEIESALRLTRNISAQWKRAIGVQEIARVQAVAGDRIGAKKTLRKAYRSVQEEKDLWLRVRALIQCAGASILVGDEEEALKVADSLPNDVEAHEAPMRHQALMAIVEALGTIGRLDSALKVEGLIFEQVRGLPIIERFSEPEVKKSIKLEVYPAMIKAYSQAGYGAEALTWARRLADPEVKGRALLAVAEGTLKILQPPVSPIKKQRFGFPV